MKKLLAAIILFLLFAIGIMAQDLPIGLQRQIEHQRTIAVSITFLIAFLAGIITFTSPCGFVVLPAYLSFSFKERKKSFLATAFFSLGLISAFVIFGIIAAFLGNFFNDYKLQFAFISGFILILFGILIMLNKGFSIFTFHLNTKKTEGILSFFSLGFFFAVGWTPCIGLILAGIFFLAANLGNLFMSILLLITFGFGIVTPLLLISFFIDKYNISKYLTGRQINFILFNKRFITHTYNIISGIILIFIGTIMLIYKGTFFFQGDFLSYVPWSMSVFSYLNESLVSSKFFTSVTGNIIGLIIVIGIIYLTAREIWWKK